MTTNTPPTARAQIIRGLIIAALFLAIAATIRFLSPEHISPELARRTMGVIMGALVVLYSNAAPKTLSPLARLRCNPAAEQAIRRFAGWALTLGGAAYMLTWLIAPIEYANVISMGLLATALLMVVARVAWSTAKRSKA